MKCSISAETLTVRGAWGTRFSASSSDISEVKVMAQHEYYGPFIGLRAQLFGNKVQLRFIMLRTLHREFTLDVKRDTGATKVVSWLSDIGWNINSAVQEAIKTPLVRTVVQRS